MTQRWDREVRVAADGGEMDMWLKLPRSGSGPGVMLLGEIFGVNEYVADVADRLAEEGYVVGAPDVFWRSEPRFAVDREEEFARAMALAKELDVPRAVQDLAACLQVLADQPETTEKLGAIGFCMGGTLAFSLAAERPLDACVAYYGAGIPGMASKAGEIKCPVLMHFGGQDPVISADAVEAVRAAVEGIPTVEVLVHPEASHAFDNHRNRSVYHADSATRAWETTSAFLEENLAVGA